MPIYSLTLYLHLTAVINVSLDSLKIVTDTIETMNFVSNLLLEFGTFYRDSKKNMTP